MNKSKSGFTIVELLIVIVVIGILAAIVIVTYGGVQNRANDAAMQADMRNNAQKIAKYEIENGVLPTSAALRPAVPTNNSLAYTQQAYNYVLMCVSSPDGITPTYIALRTISRSGKTLLYDTYTRSIQEVTLVGAPDNCSSACRPAGAGTTDRCSTVTNIVRTYDGTTWF